MFNWAGHLVGVQRNTMHLPNFSNIYEYAEASGVISSEAGLSSFSQRNSSDTELKGLVTSFAQDPRTTIALSCSYAALHL